VLAGGRGFSVGSGGVLHAWSVLTGRDVWSSPGVRLEPGSPVVANGRVYQPGWRGRTLFVLDTAGGRILNRRAATPAYHFLSGASIVDRALWIREFQPCLQCADIDGEIYARAIAVAPGAAIPPRVLVSEFVNESSAPAVGFGHMYSTGVDAPAMVAYPVAAGAFGWQANGGGDAPTFTLAGGAVYPDQCGCALSAATGKVLWTMPNFWIAGAPAIANGVVYFAVEQPEGTTQVRTFHLP